MDNAFLSVVSSLDRMQTEWNRSKHGSGSTASVIGLWKEGRHMHHFLRQFRKDIETEYAEIAKKFDGSYLQRQRWELEDRIRKADEDLRKAYKADIDTFVNSKERLLDQMLITAPSERQMQLLQSLQMRGTNLTKGEALRIAPYFYNNFNALKSFQTICDTAKVKVHFPMESDALELYGQLADLRDFFYKIANEIGKAEPDFMARSFFFINPEDPEEVQSTVLSYAQIFDVVPQLQTYNKKALSAGEEARVKTLFRDFVDLDEDNPYDMLKIRDKTENIMSEHKEDIPLILQTEYGRYVRMVTNLQKAKASADAVEDSIQEHGNSAVTSE